MNIDQKMILVGMKRWMTLFIMSWLLSDHGGSLSKMKTNITFFPNLPVGQYKIHITRISSCNSTKNDKLQFNWSLAKTSSTSAEFKGNITTFEIIFDDNLTYKVRIDTKDSFGIWAKNSVLLTRENACSTFQSFIKKQFVTKIGLDGGCPKLPGVYITSGFPATNVETALTGLPQVLPYGSYKFFLTVVNKKNEYIGCVQYVIDVKRPWDMP